MTDRIEIRIQIPRRQRENRPPRRRQRPSRIRRDSIEAARAHVEEQAQRTKEVVDPIEMRMRMMETLARRRRIPFSSITEFFGGGRLGRIGRAVTRWGVKQQENTIRR